MRQGEAPSPCAAPPSCPHACLTWRTRPPLLSRSPFSFFRRYRSSIFYHTEAQKAAAEKVRAGPAPRDEADGGEGRGGARQQQARCTAAGLTDLAHVCAVPLPTRRRPWRQ